MDLKLPLGKDIISFQQMCVEKWHENTDQLKKEGFWLVLEQEHLANFRLWHVEDEARRKDVSMEYIAEQKQKIDRLNQERNDLIEKIDETLIAVWPWIEENSDLAMNTETPGSVMDRLSISSLKLYHMKEESLRKEASEEHRNKAKGKVERIMLQRDDLVCSLDELLEDLFQRKKRLQIYRQFKMYNDPALNPSLYKNASLSMREK